MWIAETVEELRDQRERVRGRKAVALVPTMGALHPGHLSLIEKAQEHASCVVATIFVNPTQFGPGEDFDRYPRTLEADLEALRSAGTDGVFTPAVDEVYPPGKPEVVMDVPSVTQDLEGAKRPGHFAGVCRVVAKLLCMALPDVAVFGRKDYQQLCVIRAMAADLCLPTQIIASDTVRESDGLAMSSRNRYLNQTEREQAIGLYEALQWARQQVRDGARDVALLEAGMTERINARGLVTDYAAVRDAETVSPQKQIETPTQSVALVAGRLGAVRLIDNQLLG